MITTSVAWDFILWAFFWIIVAWALWWGVQDTRSWLKHNGNPREDIQSFPDEAMGETGQRKSAANGSARHDGGDAKQTAARPR